MDNQTPEVKPKRELTPDELAERQAAGMSSRQMVRRVKRIARGSKNRPTSNMDATWAIVLGAILENTKPVGSMEPYLR